MAETVVTLPADVDLHARPAAEFVRTAVGFTAKIEVWAGDRAADARSLIAVMALGARGGTPLRLTATGDDADVAVQALSELVTAFH